MINTILYSSDKAGYFISIICESYSLNSNNSITLRTEAKFYKLDAAENYAVIDREHLEYIGYFPIFITANDNWTFSSIAKQLFNNFKKLQRSKYGVNSELDKLQLEDLFSNFNKAGCIRRIFSDASKKATEITEDDFLYRLENRQLIDHWNKVESIQQIVGILYSVNTDYQYKYECIPKEPNYSAVDTIWYLKSLFSLGEDICKLTSKTAKKNILYYAILQMCTIIERYNLEPYKELIAKYKK